LDGLEFCQWHSKTQLGEQEFKLLDGLSLPFFKGVYALLDEAILLTKVGFPIVILSAEKVLLLSQGLVFPCQS
jgi:hypothetical protein